MAKYVDVEALIAKIKREIADSPISRYYCEDGTEICTDVGYVYDWFTEYAEVLRGLPAVEVIRCGQCKWWSDDRCQNINGAYCLVCNPNWFCGSGERRDNDG